MAPATLAAPARTDWILSNPWLWSGLGFLSCFTAWLIQLVFGEDLVRLIFIFFGLVAAGAGLAIRLQSSRPAFLGELGAGAPFLMLLSGVFGLIALAPPVLLILATTGLEMPWKPIQLVIASGVVTPIAGYAAWICFNRVSGAPQPVTDREEGALL